jgi:hypothetical protein
MPLGVNKMDLKSELSHELTPKTLMVIAAAITEFLGKKVKIRSAKIVKPTVVNRWALQGRAMVQSSHNLTRRGS